MVENMSDYPLIVIANTFDYPVIVVANIFYYYKNTITLLRAVEICEISESFLWCLAVDNKHHGVRVDNIAILQVDGKEYITQHGIRYAIDKMKGLVQ